MTVKVKVQNFQSLKEVELEIQGFTVITGSNNAGKSALQRAIRGAVQNTKGTSFVRRGSASTKVELTFDDGRSLTWEKGAKVKPVYSVDGGPPINPGAGVPDEVRDLGIRPIRAGGEDIWPQIAPQFHQVFLIDQPGSVLAEAISDVDRVTQLNDALKASKSDQAKASSTLQVRQDDVKTTAAELLKFEGLEGVVQEVKTIEADALKVQKISKAVEGFSALRGRLQKEEAVVASLLGLEQIKLPTDVEAPGKVLLERDTALALQGRLEAAQALEARWRPLGGLQTPSSETTSELQSSGGEIEDLRKMSGRLDIARALETRWSPLAGLEIPAMEAISSPRATYDELGTLRGLSVRLESARKEARQWEALEGLQLEADTTPVSRMLQAFGVVNGLYQRWETATSTLSAQELSVEKAQIAAAQAEADFSALLVELGECPVCGGDIKEAVHPC